MPAKLKEQSPVRYTTLTIDRPTRARLTTLCGKTPVAEYLRDLTTALAQDVPPSMDDLLGGYSLMPLKRQLERIEGMLQTIWAEIKDLNDRWACTDTALTLTVKGYDGEFRRLWREVEQNREMDAEFEKAKKESPEYQDWELRRMAGEAGPLSPGFMFDAKKGKLLRNPDGKPKVE